MSVAVEFHCGKPVFVYVKMDVPFFKIMRNHFRNLRQGIHLLYHLPDAASKFLAVKRFMAVFLFDSLLD